MPKARFKCPECGEEAQVTFSIGKAPDVPDCVKCGAKMGRDYGKIEQGENESDTMTRVKQMMKNSQSFSGRDKTVF